jgi:hypothetical protein
VKAEGERQGGGTCDFPPPSIIKVKADSAEESTVRRGKQAMPLLLVIATLPLRMTSGHQHEQAHTAHNTQHTAHHEQADVRSTWNLRRVRVCLCAWA